MYITKPKVASLYQLVEVGLEFNEGTTEMNEVLDGGYETTDFIEIAGIADRVKIPHSEFAKSIFNNKIIRWLRVELGVGDDVHITQSEWVETVSESGDKAFDCCVIVSIDDDNRPNTLIDVSHYFFRVVVTDFEV